MSERIQKLLATAGVASRREIERLIDEGRILVNGKPAELGQKVDHEDHIRVDGRPVSLKRKAEPARVLIYKKRVGELVTRDDPEGRRTVFRKLPKLESGRWIAVGRLDINTSGLLLFTNHGELARRLTHPSFEIPRTYAVRVLGTVDDGVIARWKAGVELDDGVARFERVEAGENEDGEGANQWFHVSVREGRNRLVRRLIESQDLQVSRLIRISYGPIELGRGIKSGTAREATPAELLTLLDAVGLSEAEAGLEAKRRPGRGQPSQRPAPRTAARGEPRGESEGRRREPGAGRGARARSEERREPRAAERREVREPREARGRSRPAAEHQSRSTAERQSRPAVERRSRSTTEHQGRSSAERQTPAPRTDRAAPRSGTARRGESRPAPAGARPARPAPRGGKPGRSRSR